MARTILPSGERRRFWSEGQKLVFFGSSGGQRSNGFGGGAAAQLAMSWEGIDRRRPTWTLALKRRITGVF